MAKNLTDTWGNINPIYTPYLYLSLSPYRYKSILSR